MSDASGLRSSFSFVKHLHVVLYQGDQGPCGSHAVNTTYSFSVLLPNVRMFPTQVHILPEASRSFSIVELVNSFRKFVKLMLAASIRLKIRFFTNKYCTRGQCGM